MDDRMRLGMSEGQAHIVRGGTVRPIAPVREWIVLSRWSVMEQGPS